MCVVFFQIDRQGNVIRKGNNAQLKRPQTSNRQSNPFFNSNPPRNVSSARPRRVTKRKSSLKFCFTNYFLDEQSKKFDTFFTRKSTNTNT